MRTAIIGLVLSAALGLLGAGCKGDDPSPSGAPNALRFVAHTDYGCAASRGGSLDCLAGATLSEVTASADTVVLWIRFEANCCPEFTETVSYDDGVLDIAVVDTLYACRCVCEFENAFRFVREGGGEVRVLFESRAARGGDFCLSGMDTTITLP